MPKEKLSKKELNKYLGLTRKQWSNIYSKRVLQIIEAFTQQLIDLEEQLAYLREYFTSSQETRLNRLFSLYENNLDQLRILLAAQAVSTKLQYEEVSNSFVLARPKLKKLALSLKSEGNKLPGRSLQENGVRFKDSVIFRWKKLLIKHLAQMDKLIRQLIGAIPKDTGVQASLTLSTFLREKRPLDFSEIEKEISDEAIDDSTINEVLRTKERLLGFNPIERENTRLMYELYLKNPLKDVAVTPYSTIERLSPSTITEQLKDNYKILYFPQERRAPTAKC